MSEGIVVPIHDGVPGSPEAVPGSGYLGRVACIPASNRCVAVGPDPGQKHGVVIPISGGVPGTAIPVAGTTGLGGIACVSSGTCQVVGTNGTSGVRLAVTGTSIGVARVVPGTAGVGAISCTDASNCVALGFTVTNNSASGSVLVTIGSGATAVIGRDLTSATAVGGGAARLSAVLKAGGYPASVAAPAPGLLSIDWYYVPAGAHVSRAAKPTFVAVGAKRFSSAQKTKLVVKLRAPGRKLLGKSKRIKLTAIATFTPKQGKPTSRHATITLK